MKINEEINDDFVIFIIFSFHLDRKPRVLVIRDKDNTPDDKNRFISSIIEIRFIFTFRPQKYCKDNKDCQSPLFINFL